MDTRYFDELQVGDRFTSGGYTFTEADIIEFAWRYDPQPFHIDQTAAQESPYAGLIASGYHTAAVTWRLFLMTGLLEHSSMGSPGVDELRWTAPVRPGDTLHAVGEVIEVRPSKSKPDRGLVRIKLEALDNKDQSVMSMILNMMIRSRPAED